MRLKRTDDPITRFDLVCAGMLVTAAAALLAMDIVTSLRIAMFAWNPPAVHAIETPIWVEPPRGRVDGSALRAETSDGRRLLTTGPSTILGRRQSGVDSKRVFPGIPAKVAWIDAPARLGVGTAHYPIRVEQAGRVLLELDGARGVARAELPCVLAELGVLGFVFAGLAWWWIAMRRRDELRRAAARAAWHARHHGAPPVSP